ncbi:MAG: CotH kinase family protein [Bacteroidales bacterium]|nr:CotH kinase family protein [Bacteroidales bacterium]
MKISYRSVHLLLLWIMSMSFFWPCVTKGQQYDTISNWDGIVRDWYVSTAGSEPVINPSPDSINSSEFCFKVISGSGMWDFMISDLEEPVNFELYPRYRIKVMAPPSGGDVALKFENYNNTFSQEIVKTPVPGQWTDLVFDFTGLACPNLTRIVIFWDFKGTTPGIAWYIDDVLKEIPWPIQFQSNLPIVVINTNGIPIPDEPKISAHMGIINHGPGMINDLNDPFTDYDGHIGIEIRGQSTQMFPKKSFAFETRDSSGENLNVPLLGMPSENDWVLYAPYTDKSMLRNVITFYIARSMGHYCTRTVFCELFLNNDYRGVYVMMEKIKRDKNRVDIAALDPDEVSGDDLTGGYILRVDKIDPNFIFGYDGWKSNPVPAYPNAMDIIFQYYDPKPDELVQQQKDYIKGFITVAENTLTFSNFKDPDEGYQQYFDVLSFIDFMLLSELSKEVDKYRYSNYFYKEKDSDGGKLFAGPAWDFNLGYGNVDYWTPGIDYTGWVYDMVEPYDWSIMFWWKRLMEDSYFMDMAKTRWAWLRQHKLTNESIQSTIDSILIHIDAAKDRNYDRWPILGTYVWPNYDWYGNTYEDEVDYFEDFLFNRLGWMDYNLPGQITQPRIAISGEANLIHAQLHGDYFTRKDLKIEDFQLNHAPEGVYIQSVTYKTSSACTLNLTTTVSNHPGLSVTVSEVVLNYWEDLTSNTLETAGTGDSLASLPGIRLFVENHRLHILCDQPDRIPEQAEIINIMGQIIRNVRLDKKNENIIPLGPDSGLYLLVINSGNFRRVMKFSVVE